MTEQQETPVTNQENTAAPAETPVETPQQPTEQQPAVLIPPSQRQISPKARMISRLIGTLITVTILAVVIYMEFAGDKKSQSTASKQATPEQLTAQLEKMFTANLMGSKPAQIKQLQGNEYGIWLDQASGEADIKTTYNRKKKTWMLPKEGLSQAAKDKIAAIRQQNLIVFLSNVLGKKPHKVIIVGKNKNQFEVWMDEDAPTFTLTCNTKTQTWRGVKEDDQKMFEFLKEFKQVE